MIQAQSKYISTFKRILRKEIILISGICDKDTAINSKETFHNSALTTLKETQCDNDD